MIFLSALALLVTHAAHADPCAAPPPRGPAVPAPIVLSTDCGWFRLETGGAVSRLPIDWLAKQNRAWRQRHGDGLTTRRTHAGRYLVVRRGRVVWRSAGLYYNEAGSIALGPRAFAFDSYGRRGVFLTDLRGPERLVLRGRGLYPIDFTDQGYLLVSGRRTITVLSPAGKVVRRYRYRHSSSFSFDLQTRTLYFVAPDGMLSAVRGPAVRRIRRIGAQGAISTLGRRLLVFTAQRHVAILRRDGSFVAQAGWRGARRELDAGVVTSDDGRAFAFRVTSSRPGARNSPAFVYLLRAGESRAHVVYRHRIGQAGCGTSGSLSWHRSALLYRSVDGTGPSEAMILAPDRSRTTLTPLLRALPRIAPATPGNVFWATDFLP